MKFKVEIIEKRTEEIEINFPAYRKSESGRMVYKITGEKVLQVCNYENIELCEIQIMNFNGRFVTDTIETTESEFNQAFETVIEKLKNF